MDRGSLALSERKARCPISDTLLGVERCRCFAACGLLLCDRGRPGFGPTVPLTSPRAFSFQSATLALAFDTPWTLWVKGIPPWNADRGQ